MKWAILVVGVLSLMALEILRVYYIMPFPGSQEDETIQIAYWLNNNMTMIRLVVLIIIAYPFAMLFRAGSQNVKVILFVTIGFYGIIFYMFNSLYVADHMFLQPKHKGFLDSASNKVRLKQLVLGVTINNESKAYPIEVIGYHHQVRDEVGGEKIMVTYCTVCRTGRVFKPEVDGVEESFRLVGMDHYNAMFEDTRTGSWWRQVNGEAIIGPLKGKILQEVPSQQMSLGEWLGEHPSTKILQPDTEFADAYKNWEDYDEGKREGRLERKDSLSWKDKSWIVGVQIGMESRAYDWIELQQMRIVNDNVGGMPLLILASPDSISFHVFNRVVNSDTLSFTMALGLKDIADSKTGSRWNVNGHCVSGALQGSLLQPVQAYQEYWHSWKTFRPQTTQYKKEQK